ncbi:MAG: hypothetical protein ACRYG8_02320 [Janthinobacterium lividum]
MTRDITSIMDEALSQARDYILKPQATEAGYLFGVDLLRGAVAMSVELA